MYVFKFQICIQLHTDFTGLIKKYSNPNIYYEGSAKYL